jgi:hypothetical protein
MANSTAIAADTELGAESTQRDDAWLRVAPTWLPPARRRLDLLEEIEGALRAPGLPRER